MKITSTEAQNNFGRYLKLAQFEDIIVTKNGKKAIVISRYQEDDESDSSIAEKAACYDWQNEQISYEDFLKLVEESESRYEYIEGEVYLVASPSYEHQRIIMELSHVMYNYFKGRECRPLTAPFDVTLTIDDHENVVQPDILVICDLENINELGKYTGIPALVVEVLSPSTQKKDMLKKLNLYLHAGIVEYWLVNPLSKDIYLYSFKEHDIREFRAYKENQTVCSLVFKGLEVNVSNIFS